MTVSLKAYELINKEKQKAKKNTMIIQVKNNLIKSGFKSSFQFIMQ